MAEEPPKDVKEAADQIRTEDIRKLVNRTDIFPPQLLSFTEGGARQRVDHLIWVIKYRLSHPDSGIEAFRGSTGKENMSCKWAACKTETSLSQIKQEIATVYAPDEDPQSSFGGHLEEFVEVFEQHRSAC